jgi:hypothetical protein
MLSNSDHVVVYAGQLDSFAEPIEFTGTIVTVYDASGPGQLNFDIREDETNRKRCHVPAQEVRKL